MTQILLAASGWLLAGCVLVGVGWRRARDRYRQKDPTTGLAGRRTFTTALAGRAGAGPVSVVVLDLDRFRQVNDALGHAIGDRLLAHVARRLRHAVRSKDLVARLDGDEFGVLVAATDPAAVRAVVDRIAEALTEPVVLDGLPLDLSVAIGVCPHRSDSDAEMLLRNAETALAMAKQLGSTVEYYSTGSDPTTRERLELLADLRRAVLSPAGEGLSVYYQPQVDLRTGIVVGVEALLRWNDAKRGQVDPEELIRVAEPTTVMRLLTRRVLDDVLKQLAAWRDRGLLLRASVNISSRDLLVGEVVDQLTARLAEYRLPPESIQLELTESAVMSDSRRSLVTLHRLAALGIALSLDDFGTGYSSLQHLRRLPLAEVKIDRSFVLGMVADANDAAIVQSTIDLGRALGLRVVAEGVENDQARRMLDGGGCEIAQGWYYARPMPAEDLAGWLGRYRPVPVTPAPRVG